MYNRSLLFALTLITLVILNVSCGGDSDSEDGPPTGGNTTLEITGIQPEEGPPGITVTISGSGFSSTASENTVTFNSTEAEVEEASDSELKAIVPGDATSGEVSVTVDGETANGPAFTVVEDMPAISSIEPDSGVAGTEVTITGMNFSPTASENAVTFNGVVAVVSSATETGLVTEVPAGATTGPVRVTVAGKTGAGPDFTVITTGTMEVVVSTTGDNQDEDGYTLTTNGGNARPTDIDETVIISELDEGDYDMELAGIAGNCAVTGNNPATAAITAGDTTSVTFEIDCNLVLKNKIVFSSTRITGNNKLFVMNTDGTSVIRVTDAADGAIERYPSISPDGTRIAYAVKEPGSSNFQIHIINADGTGDVPLTSLANGDGDNRHPSWSPDGTKLVFLSDRSSAAYQIFTMNADGTGQQKIYDYADFDMHPEWSPDGAKIVFKSDSDGDGDIYTINPDGTGLTKLTNNTYTDNTGDDTAPSWSPDGSRIAYVIDGQVIDVMNDDGSGPGFLTNGPDNDNYPSWSADGNTIVFQRFLQSETRYDIFKKAVYGSGSAIPLTNDDALDTDPDWSPVE